MPVGKGPHCLRAGQLKRGAMSGSGLKTGKAQEEQMFSALALEADMSEPSRHFRVVP